MNANQQMSAVLAALKKACYSEHGLMKTTGIPYAYLRPILKHLVVKGEVKKDGHRYSLK